MRQAVRWSGIAIALAAGGYFLAYANRALAGQDLGALLHPQVVLAGIALTFLYAALVPLTALAWTWLLRALGQPVRFAITGPILAATQFGKYLPGNVAHHLGRVAMSKLHGLSVSRILLSMGYETLFVLLACSHVSALTLLWAPPAALADWPLAGWRVPLIIAVSLSALLVMVAAPHLAGWLARRRSANEPVDPDMPAIRPGWGVAGACYLVYVLNFVLVGIGLWLVALSMPASTVGAAGPVFFIGAFAASWVLGFLAPGAPAGLGVREALLAVWFGGVLAPADAVALIVMLRIATTLGDLLNFAWGSAAIARQRPEPVGDLPPPA